MSKDGLKGILAGDPNDKWMNVGAFTVAAGVVSLLGINITGFEIAGTHGQFAPWLVILIGGSAMWYGTELRKIKIIADREHELAKRQRERPKSEPTRGNVVFLEWFKEQDHPMTTTELSQASFPYDDKRTKPELLAALRSHRIEWWCNNGEVKKYGDSYEVRK